jgi:transposase
LIFSRFFGIIYIDETAQVRGLPMNKNIEKLLKNNPDLAAYVAGFNDEIDTLKDTVENKQQQIETLKFTLSKFNRQLFGSKSEKHSDLEEVRNLFNLNEAEANQNLNAVEPTLEKGIKKRKSKPTKSDTLKNLKSREIVYDLTESDKSCGVCDTPLVEAGSKTRETIEVIKKAIKVMEKSITYKCPTCDSFHKKELPNLPIPGGIATPSLLAQVIVDKTANALPLYRQSEDYKRIGLNLIRQTLSNWMI